MKRKIFSFAIALFGIAFINPTFGIEKHKNDQDFLRISSEYKMDHEVFQRNFDVQSSQDKISMDGSEEANSLIDIDSLQLVGGFQEYYFIENETALNLELEESLESLLSLDNEMNLENWMLETFEIEKMDHEMFLEDWMLEPFEQNN